MGRNGLREHIDPKT